MEVCVYCHKVMIGTKDSRRRGHMCLERVRWKNHDTAETFYKRPLI
jgi:hypothetical protein